jgi:MerR family transcriptional regulator, light-induced transcriptional regulator
MEKIMDERSPIYNLKVVVSETGVKPETLRAWERRYGFPKPKRTPGGHRLYTLRDIRTINWLSERQKEGLSISRSVELWKSLEKSGQDPLHAESLSHPFPAGDRSSLELLCQEWVKACLNFDEQSCEKVLTQAFAIAPPELVCFEVLQKGLAEIGQRWFQGDVTVQQEHFASSQAIKRLHTLINATPLPTREGTLLAVCPAGETHEFGLLLTSLLLRRQGWDVVYLGANVPLLRLESTIQRLRPSLTIALAQTLPTASSLAELGKFLGQHGIPLAYGGGIFNAIPSLVEGIPGYYLGDTIEGSTKIVEKILRSPEGAISHQPIQPDYQQAVINFHDKRSLIKLDIIEAMKEGVKNTTHTEDVSEFIFQHVEAALSLGEIELLEWPLVWIEELESNYRDLDSSVYLPVLKAFIQSVDFQLNEKGTIITDFLRRAISHIEV